MGNVRRDNAIGTLGTSTRLRLNEDDASAEEDKDLPADEDLPVGGCLPADEDFPTDEDLPADEVATITDPLETGCTVVPDATRSATPITGEDVATFEFSIPADHSYRFTCSTEERSPAAVQIEAAEEIHNFPTPIPSSPSHKVFVKDPTDDPQHPQTYAIALKILTAEGVFTTMVCLKSCTKTTILEKALALHLKNSLHPKREVGWERMCDPNLISVDLTDKVKASMVDFDSDDLTFVIRSLSKSGIPTINVDMQCML